jgi:hypothetical protein
MYKANTITLKHCKRLYIEPARGRRRAYRAGQNTRYYTVNTLFFDYYHTPVILLLHYCYTVVKLLSFCCYTVDTLIESPRGDWWAHRAGDNARCVLGRPQTFEREEGVCVVTLVLHCCYTVVTLLLHCYHTVITLLLHCMNSSVTLLLHCCDARCVLGRPQTFEREEGVCVVILLLHCCYTVVTLLSHCYHTAVTLYEQ